MKKTGYTTVYFHEGYRVSGDPIVYTNKAVAESKLTAGVQLEIVQLISYHKKTYMLNELQMSAQSL